MDREKKRNELDVERAAFKGGGGHMRTRAEFTGASAPEEFLIWEKSEKSSEITTEPSRSGGIVH